MTVLHVAISSVILIAAFYFPAVYIISGSFATFAYSPQLVRLKVLQYVSRSSPVKVAQRPLSDQKLVRFTEVNRHAVLRVLHNIPLCAD